MMTRRNFLSSLAALPLAASLTRGAVEAPAAFSADQISDFCRRLRPVGRILELEGWFVWCNAPSKVPMAGLMCFSPAGRRSGG